MPAFSATPLFCWSNLLDLLSTTITSADEVATKPASRLADPKMGRKFRMDDYPDPSTFQSFVIDLGKTDTFQVLALPKCNFDSGTIVEITAGNDPTFVTNLFGPTEFASRCLDAWPNGGINRNTFLWTHSAALTAQYVRVRLKGASLDAFYEMSRAYLGPGWQPTKGVVRYGLQYLSPDQTENVDSDGDETQRLARTAGRALRVTVDSMSESEGLGTMFAELDLGLGSSRDLLYVHNPSQADDTIRQVSMVWGFADDRDAVTHPSYDWYTRTFTVTERK